MINYILLMRWRENYTSLQFVSQVYSFHSRAYLKCCWFQKFKWQISKSVLCLFLSTRGWQRDVYLNWTLVELRIKSNALRERDKMRKWGSYTVNPLLDRSQTFIFIPSMHDCKLEAKVWKEATVVTHQWWIHTEDVTLKGQ